MKVEKCKFITVDEVLWLSEENRLKLLRQQLAVVDHNDLSELITWCDENCNDILYQDGAVFYFLDKDDMMAFTLRWSE